VVIVGAGFGGLGVAEELAHVPVAVTLIDRHNYHAFQPLLYQVATSLLNAEDVGAPVRSMFRHQENVTFRMAGRSLTLLTGMRNRIETLWNWGWSALTHDRAARVIIDAKDDQAKTRAPA